jgi:YD repeat-containing protein
MRDSDGRFVRDAYTFFVGTALVLFCLIAATSRATAWQPVNDGKTAGDPCHPPGQKSCGHPINIGTGNVFEEVTDYQTAGPNKLSFTRYYNTRTPNNQSSLFLYFWRSNFDRRLHWTSTYLYALRADGKQLYFGGDGSGGWVFGYGGDMDVRLAQSGSTFTLTDWDDNVETYTTVALPYQLCRDDFCAILTSIKMRNGYTQTLQYDSSYKLISVTDSYGRTLNFTYNAAGFLDTVTTPNGLVLTYSYTAAPNIVLAGVNYSTNPPTSLTYLHDPYYYTLVTGIIDENGKRYASWTYDGTGRGTSSQFAGAAELTTLAFNDNANQRTVTNALGQREVYTFAFSQNNTPKVTEIDRLASSTTAAATKLSSYDSNGYVASETD